MTQPFHLGLRRDGHRVSLLQSGPAGRVVLGTAHPDTVDRRLRILDHWGVQATSPRRSELHTIDLPLPSRTQSILTHQLDAPLQSRLNGGLGPLSQSRRTQESGVREHLHLGPAHAGMTVTPARRGNSSGSSAGPRASRA